MDSYKGKRKLIDDEEGGSGNSEPEGGGTHASENKRRSITFTQLLNEEAQQQEMEKSMESEEEMSRASVSTRPSISCSRRRDSGEMLNLDLSLLPSAVHSFHASRGGASPSNVNNAFRCKEEEEQHGQLTIFYGGAVNIYNVSADQAKSIMGMAMTNSVSYSLSTASTPILSFAPPTPLSDMNIHAMRSPLKPVNLPISRKNSLQRFLEKRSNRNRNRNRNRQLYQRPP